MFISVTGSGHKKQAMVVNIAEFCALHLMEKIQHEIILNVELIVRLKEKESVAGDCIWEDDVCNRPREFTIRIDSSQSLQDMLETVAHEMVHVKQYAKGELKDYSRQTDVCKWKGKKVDCIKTHYYDCPWEIEAHGRERGLFIRWFEQSQWKKCKWANC